MDTWRASPLWAKAGAFGLVAFALTLVLGLPLTLVETHLPSGVRSVGQWVIRIVVAAWALSGVVFAASGVVAGVRALVGRARIRRRTATMTERSVLTRAVASIASSGKTPWTWPFVLAGPILVAAVLTPWRDQVAGWAFVGAIGLSCAIWMLQTTVDSVAAASRHVSLGALLTTVALMVAIGAVVGGAFSPPIESDTFNTVAQIDAALLIAFVVTPGVPSAWRRTAKDAWTWTVMVTTSIVLGIAVAVFGSVTASREQQPRWFTADVLNNELDTIQLVPATVLLGMSALPIVLATMSMAYRTYERVRARP